MIKKLCAIFTLTLTFLYCQIVVGNDKDIEKIDQAWDEVYTNIGLLADYVRELTADGDATEALDAYKMVMSALFDNYLNSVYYDNQRPLYLPYTHPIVSNYGGPNHDFKMGMVHLEPGASYRVWGTKGNADALDIQEYNGWFGKKDKPIGSHAQGSFKSKNITVDENNNFEFTFSPQKPEQGQWWQAEEDTVLLMVRDIFLDHTIDPQHTEFYFEKLGTEDEGSTPPSADDAAERLRAFARALKGLDIILQFPEIPDENIFVVKGWFEKPDASDSEYLKQVDEGKARPPTELNRLTGGQLSQTYHMALYNVPAGKALIGEWTPPDEFFSWNILLNTRLLQSLNFFDRQTDINSNSAHIDDDGVFRFVISSKDPGVANWLDIDAHPRGAALMRCKSCDSRGALPTLTLVPEDEIMTHLPKNTATVTLSERKKILKIRRQHHLKRFHQ